MEFRKLKRQFSIDRYRVQEQQVFFGIDGQGIGYYRVMLEQHQQLLSIIPVEYQHHFDIKIMRINTAIPPHTDTRIRTTINFYIETGNAVTQFYRINTDNPTRQQVENQVDGYIYTEDDLAPTNAFTAQPTDAWVLDVTRPHAVIPGTGFEQRLAIAMASDLDYKQVCELLTVTGEL